MTEPRVQKVPRKGDDDLQRNQGRIPVPPRARAHPRPQIHLFLTPDSKAI